MTTACRPSSPPCLRQCPQDDRLDLLVEHFAPQPSKMMNRLLFLNAHWKRPVVDAHGVSVRGNSCLRLPVVLRAYTAQAVSLRMAGLEQGTDRSSLKCPVRTERALHPQDHLHQQNDVLDIENDVLVEIPGTECFRGLILVPEKDVDQDDQVLDSELIITVQITRNALG